MNPAEVWRFEDDTLRLVLSNATYNVGPNRVITCPVAEQPPQGFDPFAVITTWGMAQPDRIMMHPRHWLTRPVGRIADDQLAAVRRHLSFLLLEG